MRCLFLDLASHHGLLACTDEQKVFAAQEVDHRIGDHELIPLTEKLLADVRWSFPELTHIACVTGPGGFTSLRVAVSFVNALAHELEIPVVGVHLSDLYFSRVTSITQPSSFHITSIPQPLSPEEKGEQRKRGNSQKHIHSPSLLERGRGGEVGAIINFLWLHSTKKHELFIRGFGSFQTLWPEPIHVTDEEVLAKVPQSAQWTGELIPEHEALIKDRLIPVPLQSLVDVLPAFLIQQAYAQKLLEPWYGRVG